MAYGWMVIDRIAVEEELRRVFEPSVVQVMVNVLNQAAVSAVEVTRLDLRDLSGTMHELAQAQARTEARLEELAQAQARTEARLEELAQAQARTEARLERLEAIVEQLAQAQARTEARLERLEAIVEQLAQAQARTEARLEELESTVGRLVLAQERTEAQVQRLTEIVGDLKGRMLELVYRGRASAYFGILLQRIRVVDPSDLDDDLRERLTPEEFKDWFRVDLVLSGKPRYRPGAEPIWLVVEISSVIDEYDVARAQKRAAYLQRANYRALPLVAGEKITPGARAFAEAQHVPLSLDGQIYFWDEALDAILKD